MLRAWTPIPCPTQIESTGMQLNMSNAAGRSLTALRLNARFFINRCAPYVPMRLQRTWQYRTATHDIGAVRTRLPHLLIQNLVEVVSAVAALPTLPLPRADRASPCSSVPCSLALPPQQVPGIHRWYERHERQPRFGWLRERRRESAAQELCLLASLRNRCRCSGNLRRSCKFHI